MHAHLASNNLFCLIAMAFSLRELYLSGCKLDERIIRVDLDMKFELGRQWGRSKTGGQIKDDFRSNYDADRGGWSAYALKQKQLSEQISKQQITTFQNYDNNNNPN